MLYPGFYKLSYLLVPLLRKSCNKEQVSTLEDKGINSDSEKLKILNIKKIDTPLGGCPRYILAALSALVYFTPL